MNKSYIINGDVYIEGSFQKKTIMLQDEKIYLLEPSKKLDLGANVFDAEGKKVVPGFIDVHTHGAIGIDVNAASAEDLEEISMYMAKNGTTSWLCSVLTDTEEQTYRCIDAYKQHRDMENKGANLLGIHLEGPFLAKEYKGAMPEHLLQKANMDLLINYQNYAEGGIRYITVSPEVEGIVENIPAMKELGITVSIGHSGADYDTSMHAIHKGASC